MAHRNDNVLEILQFSYENENSTARWEGGTSGADDFASHLYVDTYLDSRLAADILDDNFDLVVLTGNPGDGKTAFLARLRKLGRTKGGRPVDIHHDATQPQDSDRSALAEDWLRFYLRDLTDEHWSPDASVVRVVGINEGMLVRTLLNPHGPFGRKLYPGLKHGRGVNGFRTLLINLNDRALVGLPFGHATNLLGRILDRLTSPLVWEESANGCGCSGCPAEATCPLLSNARLLRSPTPRQRLELLFGIAQFERYRHVSLRDALAALAYLVVGHEDMYRGGDAGKGATKHPCDYIQERASRHQWAHLFQRLFYHSAFYDQDIYEGYGPELNEDQSGSRLFGYANSFVVRELGRVDPARVSSEHLDRIELDVVSNPIGVLTQETTPWMSDLVPLEREFFIKRVSARLSELDRDLTAGEVSVADYQRMRESFLRLAYVVSRAAKRRAFFFDQGVAANEATPYESLAEFLDVLSHFSESPSWASSRSFIEATESTIPGGIIASERIPVPDDIAYLEVRVGQERSSLGARLEFQLEDPSETVVGPKKTRMGTLFQPSRLADKYVEGFPTYVGYRPFEDSPEALVVTLEMYELLHRLRNGFSESFGGQERVQQLRVFKAALKARRTSRTIIFDEEQKGLEVRVRVTSQPGPRGKKIPRVRFS